MLDKILYRKSLTKGDISFASYFSEDIVTFILRPILLNNTNIWFHISNYAGVDVDTFCFFVFICRINRLNRKKKMMLVCSRVTNKSINFEISINPGM